MLRMQYAVLADNEFRLRDSQSHPDKYTVSLSEFLDYLSLLEKQYFVGNNKFGLATPLDRK